MAEELVPVVIYDQTHEADAQATRKRLQRSGFNAHLREHYAPEGGLEYQILVFESEVVRAVEILHEDHEEHELEDMRARHTPRDEDVLECLRCGSTAVEVRPPARWRVFLLQEILAVPHIRRHCTCMSCGNTWWQYIAKRGEEEPLEP